MAMFFFIISCGGGFALALLSGAGIAETVAMTGAYMAIADRVAHSETHKEFSVFSALLLIASFGMSIVVAYGTATPVPGIFALLVMCTSLFLFQYIKRYAND